MINEWKKWTGEDEKRGRVGVARGYSLER